MGNMAQIGAKNSKFFNFFGFFAKPGTQPKSPGPFFPISFWRFACSGEIRAKSPYVLHKVEFPGYMGSSALAPIGTFWIKTNFFQNSLSLVVPRLYDKVWANLGQPGPKLGQTRAKNPQIQGFFDFFSAFFGFFQILQKTTLVGQTSGNICHHFRQIWAIF